MLINDKRRWRYFQNKPDIDLKKQNRMNGYVYAHALWAANPTKLFARMLSTPQSWLRTSRTCFVLDVHKSFGSQRQNFSRLPATNNCKRTVLCAICGYFLSCAIWLSSFTSRYRPISCDATLNLQIDLIPGLNYVVFLSETSSTIWSNPGYWGRWRSNFSSNDLMRCISENFSTSPLGEKAHTLVRTSHQGNAFLQNLQRLV